MGRDGTQRVGARNNDGAIGCVRIIVERYRLEPQHRRAQDLEPSRAQRVGRHLIIWMRARDENGHISDLRRDDFGNPKRLHAVTS